MGTWHFRFRLWDLEGKWGAKSPLFFPHFSNLRTLSESQRPQISLIVRILKTRRLRPKVITSRHPIHTLALELLQVILGWAGEMRRVL